MYTCNMNNLKICLEIPCLGLNHIIDFINLCSENKGANLLRGFADLRLCFRIYKGRFSPDAAYLWEAPLSAGDLTITNDIYWLTHITVALLMSTTDVLFLQQY